MRCRTLATPTRYAINVRVYNEIAINLMSKIEDKYIGPHDLTLIAREINVRYSVAMLDVLRGEVSAFHVLRYCPGREYLMDFLKRSGLIVFDPVKYRERLRHDRTEIRWRVVANCE